MELRGSVALVTGASAGIGLEIAEQLAAEGTHLVLAARNRERLAELANRLSSTGIKAIDVPTDVSRSEDLSRLTEAALAEFGRIDVLVNNAGVECFDYFERLSPTQIIATVQTNLTGAIQLTHLVVPSMLQQQRGAVINMASTAGKHCPAFESVYGATKAGLIGFTQGLRGEYERQGISVSAVCPGFTRNGGIFERMRKAGAKKPPFALGSTDAQAVAATVRRAIREGGPEYIVNRPPVRPAIVFREMFPRLGEKLITAVTRRFIKRAVDSQPRTRKAA